MSKLCVVNKRKVIIFLLLFFIILSNAFSQKATQKLYDYESPEYQEVKLLTTVAGTLSPSSATPVNGNELLIALERIDRANLTHYQQMRYDEIYDKIANSNGSFQYDLDISVAPQIYLTSDQSGKEGIIEDRRDFFLPYDMEDPFLALDLSLSFGPYLFIETELPLRNGAMKNGIPYSSLDFLFSYRNGTWQFLGSNYAPTMLSEIPYLARGSVGNEWFYIVIGRSRAQMGTGYTGNFIVGDNYPYQEMVKVAATSNYFTYNISLTNFGTQMGAESFEKNHFGGNHQVRLVHRLDINLLDRTRLVINFANTFYSSSAFDFRFFSPFMIFHNYYNSTNERIIQNPYDEANNLFSAELEIALLPSLNFNFQFVLDQFQMKGEAGELPNAYGFLSNLTWSDIKKDCSYSIWIEASYTSAYLYLNEKYDKEIKAENLNYNYDWILGYFTNESQAPIVAYSGYPLGPDTIAFALGGNYKNYKYNIEVESKILYRVTGEHGGRSGILNPTLTKGGSSWDSTPSGVKWHVLSFDGFFSWQFIDGMYLKGGVSFQFNWNYKNNADIFVFIPQCFIALKCSFV